MTANFGGYRVPSLHDRRLVFVVFALPFVLNDVIFSWFDASWVIYPIDYAVRLAVLTVCLLWPVSRHLAYDSPLPIAPAKLGVLTVFALPALCWVSFWFLITPLAGFLGALSKSSFPAIENPLLLAFDLSFGLLLVAVSEELVFRKLCYAWLSKAGLSQARIVLWSAAFFSITHWAGGFTPLTNTFVMGALYMMAYIRLGRIWPLVLAHWIHNFIYLGLY